MYCATLLCLCLVYAGDQLVSVLYIQIKKEAGRVGMVGRI